MIDRGPVALESTAAGFERFFRANYVAVVHIARGVVGDIHSAEDVAQDVFIAAQRRFPSPIDSSHAAAWVRVAAVHAGLNSLRGSSRREARQLRSGLPASPPGPEEIVLDNVSSDELRLALARLPRRTSTLLVLRHSGLSYREVAEVIGVKVGHVGTMLRRAEAALRKEIENATRH
ncbi:MAG: sigma-70 family RNA polymerase sigma factor [Acidimicrobiales bacterium]